MSLRRFNMVRGTPMVLNENQMDQIVDELIQRTRDNKLEWFREDNRLAVDLPNHTVVELVEEDTEPDFIVQVKAPSGIIYGWVKASKKQPSSVTELHRIASERAAKSIFVDIMDALKVTDTANVEVIRPAPRVDAEQATHVLQMMEGQWDLDFSRGRERVTIRRDGMYFVDQQKEPKYRLKVLAWNEAKSAAEVAKDKLDGEKRFQIEFLTITGDTMSGYAKHDGHRLSYRRLKS